MRKVILYSAMSLNGAIAETDGSVDWLEMIPNPAQSDYGYADFYAGVDTTLMGHATYKLLMSWDVPFPYADRENYVLTRQSDLTDTEHVRFTNEAPDALLKRLRSQPGKDIWLIGGGVINGLFLEADLIDEFHLHMMPMVIHKGINLFEHVSQPHLLQLQKTINHDGGVLELRYTRLSEHHMVPD